MIYFLHGPDTYNSQRRREELVAGFLQQAPQPEVYCFDPEKGEEAVLVSFRELLFAQGLFAQRKVFIFESISTELSERGIQELIEFLEADRKNKDLLIIFREGEFKPKKAQKKLFDFLTQKPIIHENFQLPRSYEFGKLVQDEVKKRNLKLDRTTLQLVSFSCQNDLWRLKQSLDKLEAYYASTTSPQEEELRLLLAYYGEPRAFELLDAILAKRKIQVLSLLATWPEDLTSLIPLLLWQFRILLKVKFLPLGKSISGVHPYVLQKARRAIHNFSPEELKSFWEVLYQNEIGLRQGRPDAKFVVDRMLLSS